MAVEVLCIGHAAYDLSVFVEKFPEENSKCETQELLESGGGPASNAAYLLSKWGIPCGFAGLVGDDKYGRQIRDELEAVGTDISLFKLRTGHNTPVSMIVINRQTGSRTIVNRKSKASHLRLDDEVLIAMSPKVLLFDGHEPEASFQVRATFPNAISILDAGSWREGTAKLSSEVNYLMASERFARQATGLPHLKDDALRRACLAQLRQSYPSAVAIIVTMGECGLMVEDKESCRHIPAFPARAVDTTAAGDIFHGAFAYAILKKVPLDDGLRFASMAASLSVGLPGGRQSIPLLSKVREGLVSSNVPEKIGSPSPLPSPPGRGSNFRTS